MSSFSNSLLWRGILALVVGIIAIAWPGVTVFALVIIFAIAAFSSGFVEAVAAFSSDGAGPVIGHLLLGLIDLAAGVAARRVARYHRLRSDYLHRCLGGGRGDWRNRHGLCRR